MPCKMGLRADVLFESRESWKMRTFAAAKARGRRAGFTLVEMVVVLMIIAATAMLVLPRLGFLKDQADDATGANTAQAVMSNLEAYKLSTGSYPTGFDTLIDDSTSDIYDAVYSHGYASTLTVLDPSSAGSLLLSIAHGIGGPIYNHDASDTTVKPGNTGSVQIASGYSLTAVAEVTAGAVFDEMYPTGTQPAGEHLIAVGLGPNSSVAGKTMANVPTSSRLDADTYYNRYIAIFKAYEDGRFAQLAMVVDPSMYTVTQRIEDFQDAGPE